TSPPGWIFGKQPLMESRPPQESPRRPVVGRKPNGPGGAPPSPWVWLFLIVVVFWFVYQYSAKNETEISYSWFLDQVENDNIESISVQGVEARGVLREPQKYKAPKTTVEVLVTKYVTYFPSEFSVEPVITKLRSTSKAAAQGSG